MFYRPDVYSIYDKSNDMRGSEKTTGTCFGSKTEVVFQWENNTFMV